MRTLRLVLLFPVLLGCLASRFDWLKALEAGDYSSVEAGRYPHRTEILASASEHGKAVDELRKAIGRDPKTMNRIAEHFFPQGEGDLSNLRFRWQFAGTDDQNSRLVLRYFAAIQQPFIFAGYQVQFVFQLPGQTFEKVYIDQLPLE